MAFGISPLGKLLSDEQWGTLGSGCLAQETLVLCRYDGKRKKKLGFDQKDWRRTVGECKADRNLERPGLGQPPFVLGIHPAVCAEP